MEPVNSHLLAINGGSSSIKFALYSAEEPLKRELHGQVDRIGLSGTTLTVKDPAKNQPESRSLAASDHQSVVDSFIDWLETLTPHQLNEMVNHQSGLIGVSETSSDMRDLLAKEATDVRAAEVVALFCYQAKKWIGSFAAALGGLDTLVFAEGIGKNASIVRARICDGLGFLGIELDESRNMKTAEVISTDASRVTVRIIRTDEERMIARSVLRWL